MLYDKQQPQEKKARIQAILEKAISTYGTKTQVDMAIEEMSELTKALCKERRSRLDSSKHAETITNVIEEIADVSIMLQQMIMIFDSGGEVEKEIQRKVERLARRLSRQGRSKYE